MNQITEAAEQYYGNRNDHTPYREYETHVTHYLAFMKERGFEMLKVEGDDVELMKGMEAIWMKETHATAMDCMLRALAIGEARGRDKEEIKWLSNKPPFSTDLDNDDDVLPTTTGRE